MKNNKRGISLIVLVITIIVMIILAATIILTLNSNNITGKASEAKKSSDLANKKEAATVYLAEYQINLARGKIDSTTTANDYVRAEMKKAGLKADDIAVTDEGEILVGSSAKFYTAGVKIGDTVKGYDISKSPKSYTTSGWENIPGWNEQTEEDVLQPQTINKDSNITWKYVGNDEDGNALILADMSSNSQEIHLNDACWGLHLLNKICKTLYSSNMGEARSINLDDVIKILELKNIGYQYYGGPSIGAEKIYELLTLREFYNKFNVDTSNLSEEVKKNLDNIYANDIVFTSQTTYKQDRKDLIFGQSYWLASATYLPYSYSPATAEVNLARVYGNTLSNYTMSWLTVCTDKEPQMLAYAYSSAIRPIVKLSSNVDVTYTSGVATLS